jgi:hypothetical protein
MAAWLNRGGGDVAGRVPQDEGPVGSALLLPIPWHWCEPAAKGALDDRPIAVADMRRGGQTPSRTCRGSRGAIARWRRSQAAPRRALATVGQLTDAQRSASALLVSHWYVASDAAVKLTTGAFSELKADPRIGRVEALRRSMANMITKSRPEEALPEYWAPFVLVGEGAR